MAKTWVTTISKQHVVVLMEKKVWDKIQEGTRQGQC
jgi:hypothetical protein